MKARQKQCRRTQGFTLLELLVTLGIIITLSALVTVVNDGIRGGTKVKAAVSSSSTLMQSARELAVTRNTVVRLLVNHDSSDLSKNRRCLVVVYRDLDASGSPVWKQEGKAVYLPEGVYFDTVGSTDESTPGNEPFTVNMEYPGALTEGAGPEWICYEFSSNGVCQQPGAGFVVVPAVADAATGDLTIVQNERADGFKVQRLGGVVFF